MNRSKGGPSPLNKSASPIRRPKYIHTVPTTIKLLYLCLPGSHSQIFVEFHEGVNISVFR